MNDFLLVAGFLTTLVAGIGILKPLRFFGQSRAAATVCLVVGSMGTFVGATRSDAGGEPGADYMRLDDFLPRYDHREIHAIRIHASQKRIFRAIQEVTIRDLGPANILTWLRSLPERFSGENPSRQASESTADRPLLDLDSDGGFTLLAQEPDREMVLGFVGQFWRPSGNVLHISSPDDYLEFDRPGFAKAAWNLHLEVENDGWCRLSTETRILGTDAESQRKFTRYWTVIYPGSAFIRRVLLKAVKRKAEIPER